MIDTAAVVLVLSNYYISKLWLAASEVATEGRGRCVCSLWHCYLHRMVTEIWVNIGRGHGLVIWTNIGHQYDPDASWEDLEVPISKTYWHFFKSHLDIPGTSEWRDRFSIILQTRKKNNWLYVAYMRIGSMSWPETTGYIKVSLASISRFAEFRLTIILLSYHLFIISLIIYTGM